MVIEGEQTRGHGWVIALTISIGALVLALAAWLILVRIPRLAPQIVAVPSASAPTGWDLLGKLNVPDGIVPGWATIMSSGVVGVVIVAWRFDGNDWKDFQVFDTATKTTLWEDQGWAVYPVAGDKLAITGDPGLDLYSVRTGTGESFSLGGMPDVVFVGRQTIVNYGMETGTLCGRRISNPRVCAWQRKVDVTSEIPDPGVTWIDTSAGVIDADSGQPAGFGYDANSDDDDPSVWYVAYGPQRVVRYQRAGDDLTCQLWDTRNNEAINPDIVEYCVDFAWPDISYFLTQGWQDDDGNFTMTAISWQSGQEIWQALIHPTIQMNLSDASVAYAGGSVIVTTDADVTSPQTPATQTVLNATNGSVVWTNTAYRFVGDISHIAYMTPGQTLNGFDASSPNFEELWSIPLPSDTAEVSIVDGVVYALSESTGELWVLRN